MRAHARPPAASSCSTASPARGWATASRSIAQRGDGLDERLAAAFDDVGGPTFLVGMDTPQLTPALLLGGLARARRRTRRRSGLSTDGGYWGIGFATPDAGALVGVPMSAATPAPRSTPGWSSGA